MKLNVTKVVPDSLLFSCSFNDLHEENPARQEKDEQSKEKDEEQEWRYENSSPRGENGEKENESVNNFLPEEYDNFFNKLFDVQ